MEEKKAFALNGFIGVFIIAVLVGLGVLGIKLHLLNSVLCIIIAGVLASGLVIVQPNQALVLTFFGNYVGSIRVSGFFLTVPLVYRKKVSLRIRNFNSKKLKVNDIEGNPIEIAAVVEGAVGMAQMAVELLEKEQVLDLDEERKVQMVNNLLVAIVSDKGTQPVLNTGSLY